MKEKLIKQLKSKRSNMLTRCYNKKVPKYNSYGARGITVCDEWKNSVSAWVNWALQNGYKDGYSVERIDVNGNYEPSNVTFIPLEQQARNKTTSIKVTYHGCEKCLREWCKILKLPYKSVFYRIAYLKWDVVKSLETPFKKKIYNKGLLKASYTYKGITTSCRQLCKKFNKNYANVKYRLLNGRTIEQAFLEVDKPYTYNKRTSNLGGTKIHD